MRNETPAHGLFPTILALLVQAIHGLPTGNIQRHSKLLGAQMLVFAQ